MDSGITRKKKRSKKKHKIRFSIMLVVLLVILLGIVIGVGIYRDNQLQKTLQSNTKIYNDQIEREAKELERLERVKYPYKDKKWLAIGDSITFNNKYQGMVANLSKIATVETVSAPGRSLGGMADGLTSENMTDVDLVTIFGGTNDYGGNRSLGTIKDDKTVNTFYGNIRNVIDKIQSLNPNVRIVFITPLKRGKFENQPVYPAPNGRGYKLEQYVQAIKDVSGEKSIQVIDLFNDSGIDLNNLSQFTADNLHPNDAGYEKISKVIADSLNNN